MKIIKDFALKDFAYFDKITSKTLILWGNKDELLPVSVAENFHSQIKNSDLQYVCWNYDWVVFKPKEFANIVTTWLKNNI